MPTSSEGREATDRDGKPGDARAPFVVERLRLAAPPGGGDYFTPGARLLVTPALRTSGLLAVLSDRDAKLLLLLLSFLTPNGTVRAAVPELAGALGVPEREARERARDLATRVWNGVPVAHVVRNESGLDFVTVARHVVPGRDAPDEKPEAPAEPRHRAAHRTDVVALSRARFARPRAEVEAMIAKQMGWDAPGEQGDGPDAMLRRRLSAVGVTREQADLLLARHRPEQITDQLDWLPYRYAKNPARFLIAAVEGNYEPPARVRLERAIAADQKGGEDQPTDVNSETSTGSTHSPDMSDNLPPLSGGL